MFLTVVWSFMNVVEGGARGETVDNCGPRGAEVLEEMRLQDVSYSGAPGPSHYPAPEGSAPSRIDAVYADPSWVKGVTAGYMVGPEEMQDRKGHCPMMVTVDVKVGEPGDEQEDEQG